MDARKIVVATSAFSAALVLGVVVPLGYLGLQKLDQKLVERQSEIKSVIIDLKTQTLKEIRTVTEQAAKGLATNGTQTDPAIIASLETLKTSIGELRDGQQQLFEQMKRPAKTVAAVAPPPAPAMPPPGSRDDTLNQTVYFPLGKITGPMINQQIALIIPKITDYSKAGKCLSNVMGFSDTLGGDKGNLELSQKRAIHVASLLGASKFPVGEVKGWGERWLKVHTVDGIKNEQNRRVVIETVCEGKTSTTGAAVS